MVIIFAQNGMEVMGVFPFIIGVFLGVILGFLLAMILFRTKPDLRKEEPFKNQSANNFNMQRTSIKHCPKCNSTYTDEELGYCLRDGTPLKVVGTMPASRDSDETVISSKFNL